MAVTLCTFNVNNLYVRYRFAETFPGDAAKKSAVTDPAEGYLPMYNQAAFQLFNDSQRKLAAKALTGGGQRYPDVICLQEVESLIALRSFNEQYLERTYAHALLIDGRDLRQIDVGVLSRLPIVGVRSHVDDRKPGARATAKDPWLFSRDCLEVQIALDSERRLTLLVNHLKSKFIDHRMANTPAKAAKAQQDNDKRRRQQAEAVLRIAKERFPGQDFERALFAVVGDLNDTATSAPLAPLYDGSGLIDAFERIPEESVAGRSGTARPTACPSSTAFSSPPRSRPRRMASLPLSSGAASRSPDDSRTGASVRARATTSAPTTTQTRSRSRSISLASPR